MKTLLLLIGLTMSGVIMAQKYNVTGTVTSADDGYPLPGVNISIKGTAVGTVSDANGHYQMSVNEQCKLVYSFIGCKNQEKEINGSATIDVVLESDMQMFDEVVAVGYGTMKKSDLTGAVTSVKAEQLQKTPAAGLDQAIQGRAAGVTVNANSGQPGAAAEIRIRGIGTVNNSSPIYVVDGVIVSDISFLSPSDIESTEVLKDASATAIYGSRGANGVILVTTRKGDKGDRSNITFDAYVGVQNRWNKLDLMKSEEFASKIVELNNVKSEMNFLKNQGFNNWLKAYRLGASPYYPVIASTSTPNGFDYSKVETDWQDEVFAKNAVIQNYHIGFDGGNENSNYSISGSYFDQDGTIMGSYYQRLTLRVNSTHKVRKWLTVGENLSFMSSKGRNAMNNSSSPGASVLSAAIAMAPWDPTHYAEGSYNNKGENLSGRIAASSNFKNVVNPFSMVETAHPEDKVERWVGDFYLEISPIKNLKFRSDVSLDLSNNRSKTFKEAYEYSSFDKSDKNYLASSMSRYSTIMFENTLNYSFDINQHSISAMVGQTTEEYNYYTIGGSGASILNPTDTNWYLSQTTEDRTYASDGVSRSRMFSMLGRLHYSYDSRYMLTVNFRADSSNKFPENLWGYFPSTALGWRLSEEEWIKDIEWIDMLKLRAGWGRIGNEKISNDNFIAKIMNTGPTFVDYPLGTDQSLQNGATVLTYVNKGGKWESTEQWNVGADFGLFNGKISGSVDLFIRDTNDMLLGVKAPAHVANRYDAIANVGTVRNRGVEISLEHASKIGDVKYSVGGNISFIDNELTALNGGERVYGDRTLSDEGLPLYTLWGYKYQGIYRTNDEAQEHMWSYDADKQPFHAGDAKYADLNNDGKIDDSDKTNLGNPFPSITYGINLGAEWRGFDLQVFFQGVYGNEIFNAVRLRTEGTGTEATLSTTMRNAWSATNLNGNIPNPYGAPYNKETSSRLVEDGTYLRLKNLQLGYTIPAETTKKIGVDRLRVYVSASNLFTITNYTGYDPEVGGGIDYGNYPQARTVTAGINMNF